jgi:hypothetical protein
MKLLATQLALGEGNHTLATQFDDLVVPQLADLSIDGKDFQTRLGSVFALRQEERRSPFGLLTRLRPEAGKQKLYRQQN